MDYDFEAFAQKRIANNKTTTSTASANQQAFQSMSSVGGRGLGSPSFNTNTSNQDDDDNDTGGVKSFMDTVFSWFNASGASDPKMPPSYDGSSVYERDEFKPQPTRFDSMVDMPSYEDVDAKIDEMFSKKGQPYKGVYESTYDEVKPQEGVEDFKARKAMTSGINTAIKGIMDTEQRQSNAMKDAINKTIKSVMSDSPDVPYVIQAGDTLSEIAVKTGTTVKELQELNNIEKADEIFTGNELVIPSNKSTKTKEDIVSSLIGDMGGVPELGSSFEGDGVQTASSGEIVSDALSVEQTLPFITGTGTQQGIRERAAYEEAYKAGLRGTELQAYMAQIAHETGNYKYVIEGDYSLDDAIIKNSSKWRERLKRDNVIDPKDRNAKNTGPIQEATPENILNSVYANRLGNGDFASGDGYKFRGRGYIQLSGRKNYKEVGDAIGIDLETNPELMEDPVVAAKASVAWWKMNVQGKVPKDDYSNTDAVSGLVNRGSPNKKAQGLADRKKRFNRYGQKITTPSTSLRPPIRPTGIMTSPRPPLRPENL